MHELPVVMDIIREMDEQAQKCGFEKITEIDLVIGELSSFGKGLNSKLSIYILPFPPLTELIIN